MRVAGPVAAIILNLGFGPGSLCAKETPTPSQHGANLGELKVQGKYIKQLVLSQKDGGEIGGFAADMNGLQLSANKVK